MSDAHTGQPANADPDAAATVASAVAAAPFVRIYGHADGDALAAVGLLAVALRTRQVPFQIHVSTDPAGAATPVSEVDTNDASASAEETNESASAEETNESASAEGADDSDGDDSLTLLVTTGRRDNAEAAVPPLGDSRPASVAAAAISRELGVDPDPLLALAGVIAAGSMPGTDGSGNLLEEAQQRGLVDRRPGVALPTADLADGLAHSTRITASFSGDQDATQALLAELDLPADLDDDAHRRLASLVAVETVTAEAATPRAADSVEAALRPYQTPSGPFETLGGYADVLSALAHEMPGVAVGLALGAADSKTDALDTWREHAAAAQGALAEPLTGRYEGVFVVRVRTDRPSALPTVARLAHEFRSPEPVTLVVTTEPVDGHRHLAAAASEPQGLADVLSSVATEFGASAGGTPTNATLQVDERVDESELLAAIREAL